MHIYICIQIHTVASSAGASSTSHTSEKTRHAHHDEKQCPFITSKQRDPNPKDNSLIRKATSTYKGFHYTSAA